MTRNAPAKPMSSVGIDLDAPDIYTDPTITWSGLSETELGFACFIGRTENQDYQVVMRDTLPLQTEVYITSPLKHGAEMTIGTYDHGSPAIAFAVELGQRLCEMQLAWLVKYRVGDAPPPPPLDF